MDYKEQDILDNMEMVHVVACVARRQIPRSLLDFDDLVSEGTLGLIRALELFDPEREAQFPTFARLHILGHMLEAHRRMFKQYRHAKKAGKPMPFTFSLDAPVLGYESEGEDDLTAYDLLPTPSMSEEEIIDRIDSIKVWVNAWHKLTPKQRTVIKMMLKGVTQVEIAKRLRIHTTTVQHRYVRALEIANQYHSKKEVA